MLRFCQLNVPCTLHAHGQAASDHLEDNRTTLHEMTASIVLPDQVGKQTTQLLATLHTGLHSCNVVVRVGPIQSAEHWHWHDLGALNLYAASPKFENCLNK